MSSDERMSSDELIRQANSRLRAPHADVDPTPEPARDTRPEAPTIEPSAIHYRSRGESTPSDEIAGEPVDHQPTRRPTRSSSWLRWVVALVVFGGWFLFTRMDDASRDETGEIVGAGDLDVMTLQVGDCFDDPDQGDEVIFDVAAVPCSEPHDNEVFALQAVAPGLSGGDYPGQETLQAHSYELCSGSVFYDYVGRAYVDSALEVLSLTPTSDSWDQGDREIVCVLYRLDFGKLTGTARGSEL